MSERAGARGIERLGSLLRLHAEQRGQLRHGGRASFPAAERFLLPRGAQGKLPQAAAHGHAAATAEKLLHLPQNEGNGIGGKAKAARFVEPLRRLQQPHTAGLKEIVIFHASSAEPLRAAMYKRQIGADPFLNLHV